MFLSLSKPAIMCRSPVSLWLLVLAVCVGGVWAQPRRIALCTNLTAATAEVLALGVERHSASALSLVNCVLVDPCSQDNGAPLAPNTWTHVGALGLQEHGTPQVLDVHRNQHSLEYAQVPQGILLETCQPDFSLFRETGEWQCNPDERARVSVSGACPSTERHSILDCIHPVQFDATRVPVTQHTFPASVFGNAYAACTGESPPMIEFLCEQLRGAEPLHTYAAAALGSTQLVRFSFEAPWGCFSHATLPASQYAHPETPNKPVECAPVNGAVFVKSLEACHFECDIHHTPAGGACTRICGDIVSEQCEFREHAVETCSNQHLSHYRCSPCQYVAGQQALPWSAASPAACESSDCPAGTSGSDGICSPCSPNTRSAAGSALCVPCEYGFFSAEGSAECQPCFSEAIIPSCPEGQQGFADVQAIDGYFAQYPDDKYSLSPRKNMFEFCHARGVCLPCQPGHYEEFQECVPCPFAHYQPHFQAAHCFQCALGQNTSRTGAEAQSECRCQPGFE